MEENKKIKQELCDMLFDIQQKLTDAEYKDLVETLAKIEDRSISVPSAPPANMMPSAPSINMMPSAPSINMMPSAPSINMMPSAPPLNMMPSAPSINMMPSASPSPIEKTQSLIDQIKNFWKKKTCTYPECTNTYDEICSAPPYCDKHLKSNVKKTSDQRCGYFNLENVQCLNKAKVGQNYCSHHVNNHTPKPAKKIVTENYKCAYVIPPKTKNGIGKCCSKYAMLGQKYCRIHIDNLI